MTAPITSPTPWTHRATGGAETIVDHTGQTVAILGRGMEPGNGALIVAAPTMRDALERLTGFHANCSNPLCACVDVHRIASAALPKDGQ